MVPMPKASAPNAPCVLVWLSPQTMVLPGWVAPSSGPITCTMPRLSLVEVRAARRRTRRSCCSSCSTCVRGRIDGDGLAAEHLLGARRAWSGPCVPSVRSGRRTGRPRSRSSLKACGVVTSWIRCRSMYSTAGVSAVSGTTSCRSQTFWKSVFGAAHHVSPQPVAARGAAAMSTGSSQP